MHSSFRHLGSAFFGQLLQALAQFVGFQRITQSHATKQFGGEVRDAGEAQGVAFAEGFADLEGAVVVQTDDDAKQYLIMLKRRAKQIKKLTKKQICLKEFSERSNKKYEFLKFQTSKNIHTPAQHQSQNHTLSFSMQGHYEKRNITYKK